MTDDPSAPGDLARLAYLVSLVGVAGVLTLALMYAIEVPKGGPYVFGAINDITGGLYSLGTIPLLLQLGRTGAPSEGWRRLTQGAAVAGGVSAASSFLLVAKVLPFAPSTAISVLAMCVQAVWLLGFGRRNRGSARFPSGVLTLARAIGTGTLVGLPIAGVGMLLPRKSVPRMVVLSVGIAVGAAAWVSVPAFWFAVARHLSGRRGPR